MGIRIHTFILRAVKIKKVVMMKRKNTPTIGTVWAFIKFGIKTAFDISKIRVVCSVLKQLIRYLLWVFYSAYFVRFVIQSLEMERPLREILTAVTVIGGVSLLLQLYQYACDNIIFPLQDIRLYQGMYRKIYKKSENVELECFENTEFYNKFSTALDGIGSRLGECVDNVSEIIGGIIGGILACWAMLEIDPVTILFLLAPLIGNFVIAPMLTNIFHDRYLDTVPYNRKLGYVNRVMYLNKYAKELRLYNIFNVMKEMFDTAVHGKTEVWKKYFKKTFSLGFLNYIFSYVIIFEGILLYGSYKALVVKDGGISFGEMAVLTSVMITASWVWVRVINAFNRSSEIGFVISDLKHFLEYEEKIPEDWDGEEPGNTIESIEFRKVSFAYEGNKKVIDNLSFLLRRGDKAALVGHNGAGKTTVIKLLLRLYDPVNGTILVNGKDIRNYNLQKYRKLFSCAFQDYQIFSGSIRDNVLLGRSGTDEEVANALKMAGVYEKVSSLNQGINSMLTKEFDRNGVILSGGEFQKIVCARAFVAKTSVALFDEPTSALDPISENELFNNIMKSVNDRIGIFISHRLSSVRDADYVFMLENGKILECGAHRELIAQNQSYAKMYKVQERNYFCFDKE